MKAPLVLPSVIPTKFKRFINTMSRWCQSTGRGCCVKGFVLHSFLVEDLYLKMYNDELEDLRGKLAENEGVENEIKLCGAQLKMLMLIIGNELEVIGVKVIPFIVTNKKSKCSDCRSYLVLREEIEHVDLFTSWKLTYFQRA